MINLIFRNKSKEQAEQMTGKKYLQFPDSVFFIITDRMDVSQDSDFIKYVAAIDNGEIPVPGVIRDRMSGKTFPVSSASTTVKMLWLMTKYPEKYLYPSVYIGPNAYQILFDIGKDRDICIYDEVSIFDEDEGTGIIGQFRDLETDEIINLVSEFDGLHYICRRGI